MDFDNRTRGRIGAHPQPEPDCAAGIVRWTANFVMRQTMQKPKLSRDGVIEAHGSIKATGGEHNASIRFHRDRVGGKVPLAQAIRPPSHRSLQEIAMKRLLIPLVGFALSVGLSTAQAETVWNFATAYKDNNFHTQNILRFAGEVEENSGGKLKMAMHTNASLLKMPEIKRGVQTAQVQIGEILLSAYGKEDPFFEVDGIPFLSRGQMTAWEVYELTLPFIRARLEKQGLMPLFSVPWPGQGLYAQKPINATSDFNGVKFRAYNALTARLAELMGAVPTTVQSAEVPQAFATGVVSAMITSAATGSYTKAWDFTTHFYDVNAMNNKNMVIMSADAFNALDADTQTVVLRAAAKAEARGWIMSRAAQAETTQALADNGMTVGPPSPELLAELKAIGETMVQEWLNKAGEDGEKFIGAYKALGAN